VQTNFLAFHGTVKPVSTTGAGCYHNVVRGLAVIKPLMTAPVADVVVVVVVVVVVYAAHRQRRTEESHARTGTD